MKSGTSLIASRYQYNQNDPLKKNQLYTQFRCYDKVTKRDLVLQIVSKDDKLIQIARDIKHSFVLLIFDVVPMDNGNFAVLTEGGIIATMTEIMNNNEYLMEEDALVIIKYIGLALKQLHQKLVVYGRLCPDNVLFCNLSLIKLGFNSYEEQVPLHYRAPQILAGKGATYSSDIFSLGVILYKMVYGVLPFIADSEKQMIKAIKGKDLNQSYLEGHSPFLIMVSKQLQYLIESMLDYYQQNRPTLEQLFANKYMEFQVETELTAYLKPKVNLLPQPFIKKYLIYRPSKMLHKYQHYYQEYSYMALSTKDKKMVTIYCPQIRMFQTEPRKVDSYYQKLKAIQQNYSQSDTQFLLKLQDADKFRQQPVFVTEYCNQGDLFNYLQKRKISKGWLKQKQINIVIYILALAIKQMRQIGVTSIHTINAQRIMISTKNLKLRQPGLITPNIQKKLSQSKAIIDYFAPELKQNLEMVQLDKSDMWSLGILYYFLISNQLPVVNEEGQIDLSNLKTDQKNRNMIGRCLDYQVQKRLQLQNFKLEGVDEDLLDLMLQQKHQKQAQVKLENNEVKSEDQSNEEEIQKDRKVMFKNRKKRTFKDYNKIIAESSTTPFRICCKLILALATILIVFFGNFLINGGYGLIRSYYLKPITLEVPYNYGTQLKPMTILTTDGSTIQNQFSQYSYEQFTTVLRCATNNYHDDSPGLVSDFVGSTQTVFCLFGYIYVILFVVLYILYGVKLDLPGVLHERKQKKDDRALFHYFILWFVLSSLLYCFFYTFAIQYLTQLAPCYGLQSLAYPKFTSIDSLLSGDIQTFFLKVFLTVILWATIMFLYGYLTLIVKKFNLRIFEFKVVIPSIIVMLAYTIICRVGFGSDLILEPSWTYKMNTDLFIQKYYGFFGFFPEALLFIIFVFDRLVDFIFWYCLKRGLQGNSEVDIKQVKIVQARYEPLQDKKFDNQKSNIYMIEHDFERFD